jgi:preprotein translocase subunit SecG
MSTCIWILLGIVLLIIILVLIFRPRGGGGIGGLFEDLGDSIGDMDFGD